jgi:DNA replication protein DnaC
MTTTDAATSYQTLRGHLAYLKLTRAEELLAAHLEAARAQQLSHVAFLEALLGEEVAATRQRRHRARLRFAHFPVEKHLADFDYDFQPSVDRALVEELATLAFLDAGTHTLFMGPPGVGKTHLAIGLGHAVVAAGYRVYYTTAADLVAAMHTAFLEGAWTQKLRFYTAPSLLVVDELGCAPRGAALPGGVRDPTTGHRNGRMKLRTADPRRCGERREQS